MAISLDEEGNKSWIVSTRDPSGARGENLLRQSLFWHILTMCCGDDEVDSPENAKTKVGVRDGDELAIR